MLSKCSTRFTKLFHRFFDINIKYHPFYFYHIRKTYGYITNIKNARRYQHQTFYGCDKKSQTYADIISHPAAVTQDKSLNLVAVFFIPKKE